MSANFIQVDTQLLKKLNSSTYRVFCILLCHSDSKYECYPSIRRIAKEYGISDKTVQKAIDELVELNIIEKTSRKTGDGKITSNLYRINPCYVIEKIEKKKKRISIIPSWFNKQSDKNPISEQEQEELQKLLSDFK